MLSILHCVLHCVALVWAWLERLQRCGSPSQQTAKSAEKVCVQAAPSLAGDERQTVAVQPQLVACALAVGAYEPLANATANIEGQVGEHGELSTSNGLGFVRCVGMEQSVPSIPPGKRATA